MNFILVSPPWYIVIWVYVMFLHCYCLFHALFNKIPISIKTSWIFDWPSENTINKIHVNRFWHNTNVEKILQRSKIGNYYLKHTLRCYTYYVKCPSFSFIASLVQYGKMSHKLQDINYKNNNFRLGSYFISCHQY